jgi:hypothetical protein
LLRIAFALSIVLLIFIVATVASFLLRQWGFLPNKRVEASVDSSAWF